MNFALQTWFAMSSSKQFHLLALLHPSLPRHWQPEPASMIHASRTSESLCFRQISMLQMRQKWVADTPEGRFQPHNFFHFFQTDPGPTVAHDKYNSVLKHTYLCQVNNPAETGNQNLVSHKKLYRSLHKLSCSRTIFEISSTWLPIPVPFANSTWRSRRDNKQPRDS